MVRARAPLVVRNIGIAPKGGMARVTGPGNNSAAGGPVDGEVMSGQAWLASLPAELAAQRLVMLGLVDFCAATPVVTSLWVGCSLGRGAGDALSDIDAALGIAAERGHAGAEQV